MSTQRYFVVGAALCLWVLDYLAILWEAQRVHVVALYDSCRKLKFQMEWSENFKSQWKDAIIRWEKKHSPTRFPIRMPYFFILHEYKKDLHCKNATSWMIILHNQRTHQIKHTRDHKPRIESALANRWWGTWAYQHIPRPPPFFLSVQINILQALRIDLHLLHCTVAVLCVAFWSACRQICCNVQAVR